jgi:predicted nucleic acid-binding protein
MALPIVVPDASVILKWVLPSADEPDAAQAQLLRTAIAEERIHVLVPSLWIYEVGNTVSRKFPMQATAWLAALAKFGLQDAPRSEKWLLNALGLVGRFGCTFYGAAYHAVALSNNGVFVTADSRYVRLAAAAGAVVALGDWRAPTYRRQR